MGIDGPTGHAFAKVVQEVLRAWHFPDNPDVTFDDPTQDIRVNGQDRRDNGKGVRAVLHAAFKVSPRTSLNLILLPRKFRCLCSNSLARSAMRQNGLAAIGRPVRQCSNHHRNRSLTVFHVKHYDPVAQQAVPFPWA
jgi:hypothetical protein